MKPKILYKDGKWFYKTIYQGRKIEVEGKTPSQVYILFRVQQSKI